MGVAESALRATNARYAERITIGLSETLKTETPTLARKLEAMSDNVSVVVRHTLVQLLTPDSLRGRVTAVNQLFIGSSNEISALRAGLTAALVGIAFGLEQLDQSPRRCAAGDLGGVAVLDDNLPGDVGSPDLDADLVGDFELHQVLAPFHDGADDPRRHDEHLAIFYWSLCGVALHACSGLHIDRCSAGKVSTPLARKS